MNNPIKIAVLIGLLFSNQSFSADSLVIPVSAEVVDQCVFRSNRADFVFGSISPSQSEPIFATSPDLNFVCTVGTQSRFSIKADNSPLIETIIGNDFTTGSFFMDGRNSGKSVNKLKYYITVKGGNVIGTGYDKPQKLTLSGVVMPEDYKLAKSHTTTVKQSGYTNSLTLVLTP